MSLCHAASPLSPLDPVFYAESSRSAWGRRQKTGTVRTREEAAGQRVRLLTSKGHPGVFNYGKPDDASSLESPL